MNFLATTSVENLLLLLLVIGLSAFSPWLAKKRGQHKEAHDLRRQADDSPSHLLLAGSERHPVEVRERASERTRPLQQLDTPPAHPSTIPSAQSRIRSRDGTNAVALVRHSQTVRQAFIASLVFGQPKTLEETHQGM